MVVVNTRCGSGVYKEPTAKTDQATATDEILWSMEEQEIYSGYPHDHKAETSYSQESVKTME